MKKIKKITMTIMSIMLSFSLLSGCGKKDKNKATTEAEINVSPISEMEGNAEDINVVSREGYILSDLTGEWIEEKYANQKPFCIMVNNIIDAMPQSGLEDAAITYEILVEGGITRLLCVYDQYDNIQKLGPIRSARVPYVQLSKMFDGFFAHFGWSPTAQEMIENDSSIENLNGLSLGETMYYRDSSRSAPHDVYTNSELIANGISHEGYDYNHNSNYEKMFSFNIEDKPLENGLPANKITTAFSSSRAPSFEYNQEDKMYYRNQYGGPHIDVETGNQLSYKNVIVMMVEYTTDGYYQFVTWNNGIYAYYFTDGQYIKVNWVNENGVTKFYKEDGTELKLNPGKTFITVFDYTIPASVIIE